MDTKAPGWWLLPAPLLRVVCVSGGRRDWARAASACKSWQKACSSVPDDLWRREFATEFGNEAAVYRDTQEPWQRRLKSRLALDWLLWEGEPVQREAVRLTAHPFHFACDHTAGELYVTPNEDEALCVFDLASGRLRCELPCENSQDVTPFSRADGSTFLLSRDLREDATLHLWDADTMQTTSFAGPGAVTIDRKGRKFDAARDSSGRVVVAHAGAVWRVPEPGQNQSAAAAPPERVSAFAVSSSHSFVHADVRAGVWLTYFDADGDQEFLTALELATGRLLHSWPCTRLGLIALSTAELSDGRCLALFSSETKDGGPAVLCVDLVSGEELQRWTQDQFGDLAAGKQSLPLCALTHRFAAVWSRSRRDELRLLCLRTGRVRAVPVRMQQCLWLGITRGGTVLLAGHELVGQGLTKSKNSPLAVFAVTFEAAAAADRHRGVLDLLPVRGEEKG